MSLIAYYQYQKIKRKYFSCPLGESKFDIDQLKNHDENIQMLELIEKTREELIKSSSSKIHEDDEYEYYIEEEIEKKP